MKSKWLFLIIVGTFFWSSSAIAQEKTLKNAVKIKNGNNSEVVKKEPVKTVIPSNCQGNCVDGWGKQEYDNGYYLGFWSNGLKHGFGMYVWDKGDSYSGDWKNDLITGFGSYNYGSGDGYDGMFKDGLKHGMGTYLDVREKQIFYDEYSKGEVVKTHTMNANSNTTGCTKGDCENGFGHYVFQSGDQFDGVFVNGKLKNGTYKFVSGDLYIGEFNSNSRFEGYGLYVYKNDVGQYAGKWVNGKRNGRGRDSYNNIIQIGEWKDDKLIKNLDL